MNIVLNTHKKVLEAIEKRDLFKRYLLLTLSLFIAAIAYNMFLKPTHIVTGGSNGIAVLAEYILGLDSSVVIFCLNAIFLMFSLFFLSKSETIASLFITIVYPVLIALFSFLSDLIVVNNSNLFIMAIYAGFLLGISNGLIYKAGFNTGGVGVVSKIISKYRKKPITYINFVISLIIVLTGAYVFGIQMIMYAVVVILITKIFSEKVLFGISYNKAVFIVSEKYDEITDFIRDNLNHDVTIYDTIGRYDSIHNKMLMVVLPNYEYFILKEGVLEIDDSSFVFVSDSYEVLRQDVKLKRSKV